MAQASEEVDWCVCCDKEESCILCNQSFRLHNVFPFNLIEKNDTHLCRNCFKKKEGFEIKRFLESYNYKDLTNRQKTLKLNEFNEKLAEIKTGKFELSLPIGCIFCGRTDNISETLVLFGGNMVRICGYCDRDCLALNVKLIKFYFFNDEGKILSRKQEKDKISTFIEVFGNSFNFFAQKPLLVRAPNDENENKDIPMSNEEEQEDNRVLVKENTLVLWEILYYVEDYMEPGKLLIQRYYDYVSYDDEDGIYVGLIRNGNENEKEEIYMGLWTNDAKQFISMKINNEDTLDWDLWKGDLQLDPVEWNYDKLKYEQTSDEYVELWNLVKEDNIDIDYCVRRD